jgi:homoserine dehydrogenase
LKLALLGYGNVGRAFARLLKKTRGRHDLRIVAVQTRRGACMDARGVALEPEWRAPFAGPGEFLDAAGADALVEVTPLDPPYGEPAITHVRLALARRMHVATANKGPVAFAWRELNEAARAAGVRFLHESATMDGTPVYTLVRNCLPAVAVTGFAGALNSTTKVIIDFMRRGLSLEEGVAEAQRLGIAEADPAYDIDGWDSAAKAAALANVWLDAGTTPLAVDRKGIGSLTPEKIAEVEAKGKTIVLVSRGKRTPAGVKLRVRAEVLDRNDPLACAPGTSNLLQIETDLMGVIGVYALHPGVEQTAYGLFSDLMEIARQS